MRKLTYIAALLVALVATGYAVADGMEGAKSATAVAGTFTATGTSTSSRTCTTTDGKTVVVTDGKYTGAATGDPDLTGAITLRARSVINTTDNVGVVSGQLRIAQASGRRHRCRVLRGLRPRCDRRPAQAAALTARPHGSSRTCRPRSPLQPVSPAASSAAAPPAARPSSSAAARASRRTRRPRRVRPTGRSRLSRPTSITVAGLTCAIPSDKSADVNAKFKQNDVAQIRCSLVSGVNTLTGIGGAKKNH